MTGEVWVSHGQQDTGLPYGLGITWQMKFGGTRRVGGRGAGGGKVANKNLATQNLTDGKRHACLERDIGKQPLRS